MKYAMIVLLLTLPSLMSSCARQGLIRLERSDSEARLIVIGDVQNLEDSAERSEWEVPSRAYDNGIGFVRWSEREPFVPAVLIKDTYHANAFSRTENPTTPFFLGIPPRTAPAARYEISGGKAGIPLKDIFRELADEHGELLFIAGPVDASELDDTGSATIQVAAVVLREETPFTGPYRRLYTEEFARVHRGEELTHLIGIVRHEGDTAAVARSIPAGTPIRSGVLRVYRIEGIEFRPEK